MTAVEPECVGLYWSFRLCFVLGLYYQAPLGTLAILCPLTCNFWVMWQPRLKLRNFNANLTVCLILRVEWEKVARKWRAMLHNDKDGIILWRTAYKLSIKYLLLVLVPRGKETDVYVRELEAFQLPVQWCAGKHRHQYCIYPLKRFKHLLFCL